jgi:hypothetical protein
MTDRVGMVEATPPEDDGLEEAAPKAGFEDSLEDGFGSVLEEDLEEVGL